MRRMFPMCLLAASVVPALAGADVPEYEFGLVCRSNFSVNPGGSYRLTPDSFFNSATPTINDAGLVAIKVGVVAGMPDAQAIYAGSVDVAGGFELFSSGGGFFSDPSVNNAGRIVVEQYFGSQNGIFFADAGGGGAGSGLLTNRPLGASGWGSPTINAAGIVGYRADFNGPDAFVSWSSDSDTPFHAADVGVDPVSPYSFLFTPMINDQRVIAAKVRLGGAGQTGNDRPDQIRLFASDGSSTLIAEDRDSDGASPYTSFDNAVSVNGSGVVVFIANLASGGRAVVRSDGTADITIATTNDPGISEIDFFRPALNDAGLVAFRGKDASGLDAIYVGDGTELIRLVGEEDVIPSDLGPARVGQETASSPAFGGSPAINNNGDVAFAAGLTPPGDTQTEWGSGLFVARAILSTCPADWNADGFLNDQDFFDWANDFFSATGPRGQSDFNDDGFENDQDFFDFVNAFFTPGDACG